MSLDVPFHEHWRDIHARRWLIVATTIAAGVFAFLISLVLTPIYEAKTTFYIASNASSPRFVGGPDTPPEPLFPAPDEKTAALHVGILRGQVFMAKLAEATGLPIGLVRKRVDVKVSGEFMIDVFARSESASLAAEMANRSPVLYAGFHEASMRARAAEVAQTLTSHLVGLEAQLATLTAAAEDQRRRFGATVDEGLVERLSATRAGAEVRLMEIDGLLSAALARRAELEKELTAETGTYAAGDTVLTTPLLDVMVEQLLVLRVELAAVRDGPQSPRRAAIVEQIAEIATSIEAERRRMSEAVVKSTGSHYEELRSSIATAKAEEAALTASRATAEAQLLKAATDLDGVITAQGAAAQLAAQMTEIEAQISDARLNLASAELQAAHARAPLVVVEQAVTPTRPAFPLPVLNAIVAMLTGAAVGFYYALFLGYARRARLQRLADALTLPHFADDELARLRHLVATPAPGGDG